MESYWLHVNPAYSCVEQSINYLCLKEVEMQSQRILYYVKISCRRSFFILRQRKRISRKMTSLSRMRFSGIMIRKLCYNTSPVRNAVAVFSGKRNPNDIRFASRKC